MADVAPKAPRSSVGAPLPVFDLWKAFDRVEGWPHPAGGNSKHKAP